MTEQGADELERVVAEVVSAGTPRPSAVGRVVAALARRARAAGPRATADGTLLADLVERVTPRLELRDAAALRAAYPDMSPQEVADELIRSSAVVTAAIGGACGALASGAQVTGVGLLTVPLPLLADTVLTALVEIRLVAELHAALGVPLPAPPTQRAAVVLRSWATGRAVRRGVAADGGVDLLAGVRGEASRLVRRRLTQRATRSLVVLAPALTGALAGAELNRRATRALGAQVVADLGGRPRRRWRR
ncbi:MAG TPA: hypothetical protein VFP61_03420 [Acidimicrobiales bacterium]|nr:hypothetical protein [Acidimicrobiales bacterium]